MASTGRELLGKHYGQDHLTYEEIEDLNLKAVTEDGKTLAPEDLRGKIFRIVDGDEHCSVLRAGCLVAAPDRPVGEAPRPGKIHLRGL